MIEPLIATSEKNLDYTRRLIADVPDDKLAAQPAGLKPGSAPMNHAAWVVGHLAFVADFYSSFLGGTPTAPKEWGTIFGGSSKPSAGPYPPKAELLKLLDEGHARFAQLIRAKPASFWTEPPADEKRRTRFPTNGHMLVHMIVNHEAVHLGQLSAWRRAQGLPAV